MTIHIAIVVLQIVGVLGLGSCPRALMIKGIHFQWPRVQSVRCRQIVGVLLYRHKIKLCSEKEVNVVTLSTELHAIGSVINEDAWDRGGFPRNIAAR